MPLDLKPRIDKKWYRNSIEPHLVLIADENGAVVHQASGVSQPTAAEPATVPAFTQPEVPVAAPVTTVASVVESDKAPQRTFAPVPRVMYRAPYPRDIGELTICIDRKELRRKIRFDC